MRGPALTDLDADVLIEAVDDTGSDDGVNDGAREQVGGRGTRQRDVRVARLQTRLSCDRGMSC